MNAILANTEAPADYAAERGVLGAFLLDPIGTTDTIDVPLTADDFHSVKHRDVFNAIQTLEAENTPVDAVTVGDALRAAGVGDTVHIDSYLIELGDVAPVQAALPKYAAILRRCTLARKLIDSGVEVQQFGGQLAGADTETVSQLLAQAQDSVYNVGEEHLATTSIRTVGSSLQDLFKSLDPDIPEDPTAIPMQTGFYDLDTALGGGIRAGELTIIAARPSVGKSTIALDILRHMSITDRLCTALFSLEMSRTDCLLRILSSTGAIPLSNLRSGKLHSEEDWEKVGRVATKLTEAPLFIDDTPAITEAYLGAKIAMLKRRHGLRAVVVDYLQLMQVAKSSGSREGDIAAISRELKVLAKRHEVAVIAVAQLNRGPEQRQDKRPQTSDLRESGQIEQDADNILLLYREDAYDPNSMRAGEADVIIGKARNAERGKDIQLAMQGHYARFTNMSTF